jgi:hypothetical protein
MPRFAVVEVVTEVRRYTFDLDVDEPSIAQLREAAYKTEPRIKGGSIEDQDFYRDDADYFPEE